MDDTSPPVELASGRVLADRYRLDRVLATGGMGEVWSGVDLLLGRRVAIKVLRPELAVDARLVARFRREAVAAARLSHPSIVAVYDTVSDGGTEAVVLQLVQGQSLRQVLDAQGRLGALETRRIGVTIADALAGAHRAGVVHRDVKPGNVLLATDGRILLADFGLAKVLDSDDGLSGPRSMLGTAKYLAPEQVDGRPVDGRTDLYALGIVLYECLTGLVPFREASDVDTARARLERDAAPVRSLRPGIPKPLAAMVDQLIARDPDRRPAEASTVRDDLGRLVLPSDDQDATPTPGSLRPSPTSDPDATPSVPFQRSTSAHQRAFLAAGTVIALVVAILVIGAALFARTGAAERVISRVTGETDPTTATTAPEVPVTTVVRAPNARAEIVSTGEFDPPPDGDGRENPKRIGYVTDGDPATAWQSLCYESATFYPKQGIGLVFELSAAVVGHALEVSSLGAGWTAELYVADRPAATLSGWGAPVARATNLPAGTTSLPLGQGMGRYVLLFVRQAGTSPSCTTAKYRHQVRLSEVRVTR